MFNQFVTAYNGFAKWLKISWKPPRYKFERKIPWLPTEAEIDQLIAGFSKEQLHSFKYYRKRWLEQAKCRL